MVNVLLVVKTPSVMEVIASRQKTVLLELVWLASVEAATILLVDNIAQEQLAKPTLIANLELV